MTKAEIYEKAWVLAQKSDFSIVDEIYHPDYKSFDFRTGIYANLEDDKVIVSTLDEECTYGPYEIIYENDECAVTYERISGKYFGGQVLIAQLQRENKIYSLEVSLVKD